MEEVPVVPPEQEQQRRRRWGVAQEPIVGRLGDGEEEEENGAGRVLSGVCGTGKTKIHRENKVC